VMVLEMGTPEILFRQVVRLQKNPH
jgi:hypothetical protein